jgi:hypothetical protein
MTVTTLELPCVRGTLSRMAGLERFDFAEEERADLGLDIVRDARLEEESDVIAELDASKHKALEPGAAFVENWQPTGPVVPLAPSQLVDFIPRLATEEAREWYLIREQQVDSESLSIVREPPRPVLDRETNEEARRVDAAVRGKADEAAITLLTSARRDHEHRIVESASELGEVWLRLHAYLCR